MIATDRAMAALRATWPPARVVVAGPFSVGIGEGGGNRVRSARLTGALDAGGIDAAERAMADHDQPPVFAVRADQAGLDATLAARGYAMRDRTMLWAAPVARLTAEPAPPRTGFLVWPPLQAQRDIWAEGGIGPDRIAVMERVTVPRVTILGRSGHAPAAAAFVAVDGDLAMLHALEVRPSLRRAGVGRNVVLCAAAWAATQGATTFALLATEANTAAAALYAAMGMEGAACYHYRVRPAE